MRYFVLIASDQLASTSLRCFNGCTAARSVLESWAERLCALVCMMLGVDRIQYIRLSRMLRSKLFWWGLVVLLVLTFPTLHMLFAPDEIHLLQVPAASVDFPAHFAFNKKVHNPLRVLVLPGGGIRGIISVHILAYLEKKTQRPISDLFDLIVATSTGSVIAVGLTLPDANGRPRYSAARVEELYIAKAQDFFKVSVWHRLLTLNGLLGPLFVNAHKTAALHSLMGDTLFADLITPTAILAYSVQQSNPVIFTNWREAGYQFYAWTLVDGATSPPGFYSPVRVPTIDYAASDTLIDGAVFANNPAMFAYLAAQQNYPQHKVIMLSLGTGTSTPRFENSGTGRWGLLHWGRRIIDLILVANSEYVTHNLTHLAKKEKDGRLSFYDFDVEIAQGHDNPFDSSPAHIANMQEYAQLMILQNKRVLDELAAQLSVNTIAVKK